MSDSLDEKQVNKPLESFALARNRRTVEDE